METLLTKLRSAIDNAIPLENFVQWYEDWFNDILDKDALNENEFNLLEELYTDIGYFEPLEELRKEHSCYFGEDVLISKLKDILKAISK